MRTTNKAFKLQVREHIAAALGDETYQTLPEQLQDVVRQFNDWYGSHEKKRIPNKYDAFKDWLIGLPSCLNADVEYYKISENLKTWFETCGETYKEQSGDKEAALYMHLVTREFAGMCKDHGVQF